MPRRFFIILILGFINLTANSQAVFRTIVPQQPVVEGESFLVQFVLRDPGKMTSIKPPSFKGFRLINGPNIYAGVMPVAGSSQVVQNFVYTVEALRPGRYRIPGTSVISNGTIINSNDVMVEVISTADAARLFNNKREGINGDYFLRPGEDPYEKIRQNLFLKVSVDKKKCFIGEPVVATYKLYSRLESKSDIVKNPGFYGFAVYDMVNLASKEISTEQVGGRAFDVHTIRKVQLYPQQEGILTIDQMEVKNRIEFSRSMVNKKTEQVIVEGVLGHDKSDAPSRGSESYEYEISSVPVEIRVKPLAEKNKPAGFSGAVGDFRISSRLSKDPIAKDEQAILELTIEGKGNFIQLSAPIINWPAGMEGFEPSITDSLDKGHSPLTGKRVFRYPFISSMAGEFIIPEISLSFFNPDTGNYKTLKAFLLKVHILNEKKLIEPVTIQSIKQKSSTRRKMITGIFLILLALLSSYILLRRKKTGKPDNKPVSRSFPSVDELLAPGLVPGDDPAFYSFLRSALWKFFGHYFKLTGSGISKGELFRIMKEKGIASSQIDKTGQVLQKCEEGMFTSASLAIDKQALLSETKQLLKDLEGAFFL